jgi:hypothetical protein
MRRIATMTAAAIATLGLSSSLHAQGCVLCYTQVSQTSPTAMKALEMGVISLLFPALTLFLAVCLFIYRRARSASRAESRAAAPATQLLYDRSARKPATGGHGASATA